MLLSVSLVVALVAVAVCPTAHGGFIAGVTCVTAADCPMRLPCLAGQCYIYDKTIPTPTATPSPSVTPTATPVPSDTPSPTDPVTDQAGMGSSVTGDPQFIGLDGRLFFFDGAPGKVFNLLSEQNHQLNALFVAGPHKANSPNSEEVGTFLGAFGLKAYSTLLILQVDEAGYMTVDLNGDKIQRKELQASNFAKKVDLENEVMVVVEEYREGLGQAVTVITPLFEFLIFPTVRQWDPQFNQTARGHLNLGMSVEMDELQGASLHGILGQTTPDRAPDKANIPPSLMRAFLGEGRTEDYMVAGLLMDDFRFNRFEGSHKFNSSAKNYLDLVPTTRRLSGIGSNGLLSSLRFPWKM